MRSSMRPKLLALAVCSASALAACGQNAASLDTLAPTTPTLRASVSATPTAAAEPSASARPIAGRSQSATSRPTPRPSKTLIISDGKVALPHFPGGATPSALYGNLRIVGDPRTGCVWWSGATETRHHAALWPDGWYARFFPLRIYDAHDRLVAIEGKIYDLGGGGSPNFVERIKPECRTGKVATWIGSLTPRP